MKNSNYELTSATLSDILELKRLETEQNINILSEKTMLEDIQNEHYMYFILKEKNTESYKKNHKENNNESNKNPNNIIGYIAISYVFDTMDIISVVIKKDFQKMGFACLLLDFVISFAKEKKISSILLEVRKSNIAAIKLYEKYNFKNISIRKNYYTLPTEDALIYSLNI